ncbi:MAG: hypothetical protein ACRCX2_10785 [Paraclostridium sp.]
MINFKISEFKIGDTVMRVKRRHWNGMKIGDVAKIVDMKLQGERTIMLKLDRYPNGWHSEHNFKKTTERNFNTKKNKTEKYKHELELAKKKVLELENKLGEINKNKITKLDVDYRGLINEGFSFDNIEFYQQDRKIICHMILKGKIVGKGIATAMPEDNFNTKLGCRLALCRAKINMYRKVECKIIKDTF